VETASSLYRRAETALRRGDDIAAKQLLDQLVRAFPSEPLTDSARYELALMAEKAGNAAEVRAQTREILRSGVQGPFVDPARFLRCRITLAEDRKAATLCLTRFVSDFPQSPHDEVALRALIDLAREGGRCADVKQFAETYLQRHPHGRFAADAERARSHCGD
jgi:outer membrane protein assembly factor BamD (BamD/ComL family)